MTSSQSDRTKPRGRLFVVAAPSGRRQDLPRQGAARAAAAACAFRSRTPPASRARKRGSTAASISSSAVEEFRKLLVERRRSSSTRRSSTTITAPARHRSRRTSRPVAASFSRSTGRARARCARRCPQCVTIFILPPSRDALEQRLRERSTDSDAAIARRLRDAVGDMSHWKEFDYVVVNDDFETGA